MSMRVLFALPVAMLFGCAHQTSAENEMASQPSAQPAQQAAAEPAAQPEKQAAAEPAAQPEKQAAAEPAAQPEKQAAAEPSSAAMQPEAGQPTAGAAVPAKAKPEPVAGAEPSSSVNTCGLVRVNFDFDSAKLRDDDKALLSATAQCLKDNKQLRVNVEGNTDDRGHQDYNKQLGVDRAQAVSQYLEGQGVSAKQIKLISFGEDNPLCTQADADCWAKNRRTAIRPTCRM
jgi:peptidoglycan-associated lipoprotein